MNLNFCSNIQAIYNTSNKFQIHSHRTKTTPGANQTYSRPFNHSKYEFQASIANSNRSNRTFHPFLFSLNRNLPRPWTIAHDRLDFQACSIRMYLWKTCGCHYLERTHADIRWKSRSRWTGTCACHVFRYHVRERCTNNGETAERSVMRSMHASYPAK